MTVNQYNWHIWADVLHRWGLQMIVAAFLEAAGPLTILGAQIVYLSQPLLKGTVTRSNLDALAAMLEDPQESQAFASYLRKSS
jgi:hypothetical protein